MIAFATTLDQRLAARERPARIPLMRQCWSHLLFLHWAVSPDTLKGTIPAGLELDLYDGRAWLAVVPFFMDRIRPIGMPPIPGFSWFLELNVRTYVVDRNGRPGVWFYSLDCNQPLAVEFARSYFHLPYQHARMRANRPKNNGMIRYQWQRRGDNVPDSSFEYGCPLSTHPAEPGSLEFFLIERYLLFCSAPTGQLACGQVHHAPYRIGEGPLEHYSARPLVLNGFPAPTKAPDSIILAEPVEVDVFGLQAIQ